MVTIIRLRTGNWHVHYTINGEQLWQEFSTFEAVSRFVENELGA